MEKTTIIAALGVAISVVSLAVSGVTLWLNWFRRGRLAMTKPTVIFFGYDAEPRLTPKVYLRTLLYSTSARGHVVEAMYVKLRRDGAEQIFSFWGYGETTKLTAGSGLFVGQGGVSYNHHFVLSVQYQDYLFVAGSYSIEVFARVVGGRIPIKLAEISLQQAAAHELDRQTARNTTSTSRASAPAGTRTVTAPITSSMAAERTFRAGSRACLRISQASLMTSSGVRDRVVIDMKVVLAANPRPIIASTPR